MNRYSYKAEGESFLCLDGRKIEFLRRTRSGLRTSSLSLADIDALETCTNLLLSRISFYSREGKKESVYYNTVGEELIHPFINACIDTWNVFKKTDTIVSEPENDPFEDLSSIDFKYHSYARTTITNAHVIARFYHPSFPVPSFFDASRVITSYLLAATSTILYAFSEEPPFRSKKYAEYSAMKRFMPLTHNLHVGIQRKKRPKAEYEMLTIHSGSAVFTLPLACRYEAEALSFIEEIQNGTRI